MGEETVQSRVPLFISREGINPSRIPDRGPATFGDPSKISPLTKKGSPALRPQDTPPMSLGLDLPLISSDEQALIDAKNPLVIVVPDATAPKEGEKAKKFKTVKAGAIMLSTPDISNPDLRTEPVSKDMRIEITSPKWSRDKENGLLYTTAKFVNYVDPQHPETNITEERLTADQANFINAHLPFLMPNGDQKPPTTEPGEFYLAFRPPNGKGSKGHWVTSIF